MEVRSSVRAAVRRRVARVLDLVPLRRLLWLRRTYARAPELSWRRRVLGPVLEVVRHRTLTSIGSFALIDNPSVRLVEADSLVVSRLFWFGERGYEASEAAWWRWFCARSRRILELGANIGYYTVQGGLLAGDAHYVAVEPHPGVAEVLRENLRINGLGRVVVVQAAAVGTKAATMTELLLTDRDHYGAPTGAFLRDGAEGVDRAASTSVTVELVEVAGLVTGVDLLKLDTEGHEYEILSAVEAHLVEHRPTLFVEVGSGTPKLRRLLVDLCARSGYRPYAIDAPALQPLDPEELASVSPLPRSGTRDLILTCEPMDGVQLALH